MSAHWTENAERVYTPCSRFGLLGEDSGGYLLLPSRDRDQRAREGGWWDRPLNLRNPTHWPSYLRSRITRRLAWID